MLVGLRQATRRMNAKTLILPTSHVPMLSQPQKVADVVIEVNTSFDALFRKCGTLGSHLGSKLRPEVVTRTGWG
jgi:hypothetical protein